MSEPVRTCVGCGGKAAQHTLVRVKAMGERVVVDRMRSGGRGAWLHAAPPCLERAVKRRAFARSLGGEGVRAAAAALRVELTGNARKD